MDLSITLKRRYAFSIPIKNLISFAANPEINAPLFFRRILALKLAVSFWLTLHTSSILECAVLGAFLSMTFYLSFKKQDYTVGLSLFLIPSTFQIASMWPFTLNHHVFEWVLLIFLILLPSDPEELKNGRISCKKYIQLLTLSLWFFSGLQKLIHGYYLNGEWFGLNQLANAGDAGGLVSWIFQWVSQRTRDSISAISPCCTTTSIVLPQWQIIFFYCLGWGTVLGEMFLPFIVWYPKTRNIGILLLITLQCIIALSSTEFDFALSSLACLFLFIPKYTRFAYTVFGLLSIALVVIYM